MLHASHTILVHELCNPIVVNICEEREVKSLEHPFSLGVRELKNNNYSFVLFEHHELVGTFVIIWKRFSCIRT